MLGRFADADAILEKGLEASPDHRTLLEIYATSAHNSARYAEALGRWENVRRLNPDFAMSWCGIAANARALGQIELAKPVILQALQRFPDDFVVLSEAGRVFDSCEAYTEALECWKRLVAHPSAHIEWRCALIYDLVRVGHIEEAHSEYELAVALHGEDPGLAHARTILLQAWLANVRHLIQIERIDDAKAKLELAKRLRSDDLDLIFVQGSLAMAQQDWEGAFAAFSAYTSQDPGDLEAAELRDRAIILSRMQRAEEQGGPPNLDLPALFDVIDDDEDTRILLLCFESIGADCEFGLVQRRYNAEPLGLLRWNAVDHIALMEALDARFDGMGAPANTVMHTAHDGQYLIFDKRWQLGMNTWLYKNEIGADALFKKMCRRIEYLREKFLTDLQAGEKVLVYKSDRITLTGLHALHNALKAFGPVRLINVREAHPENVHAPRGVPGEIAKIAPDLYLGFLKRMGGALGYWDIMFDDWVKICRALYNLTKSPPEA